MSGRRFVNAFTVDVEDYFHVSAFESVIQRDQWADYPARVEANTRRLLDLLDRHGVSATFFVLGWVTDRHPRLVQEIASAGHEIGCHTYWHRLIYTQTPDEFRHDIRQARDTIANITGKPIVAFRAPSFTITKRSLWALEILAEGGFTIDTSIFPIRRDRYGIPGANPNIHQIPTRSAPLWEFPASIARFACVNVPVAGGGYFRLYPEWFSLRLLSKVNRRHRRPFVFYVCSWEIDPEQPRIPTPSRVSRFRHYVNLPSTERKLERLLRRFRFGTVSQVIHETQQPVVG